MKHLTIALPVYRQMDPLTEACVADLAAHIDANGLPWRIKSLRGDALIGRSRNTLTADFLASDSDVLLQIDSDLLFTHEHIQMLIDADKDVIGGMYAKKADGPLQWVINTMPGEQMREGPLQRVRYIGTGFLMVSRSAFGHVKSLTRSYIADDIRREENDYWPVGPIDGQEGRRRYLSEDYGFCELCRQAGIPVWAHRSVVLRHMLRETTLRMFPNEEQEATMWE